MSVLIDQAGRSVELPSIPQRIISLVPSQTELLFDLGLEKEVIGITKFCVHPEKWFKDKAHVGGTKKLKFDVIDSLNPDLIVGNKEENNKEDIEMLTTRYPVWISDVSSLQETYEMVLAIGLITARNVKANEIVDRCKFEFDKLGKEQLVIMRKKAAYLIWQDPYMTVGGDTFIHSMMEVAGFENIFSYKHRYPIITTDDLKNSDCEILLLSTEPFPFKQKHIDQLQQYLPGVKTILVDGEMFSWYGSRLLYAPKYFRELQNALSASIHR